MGLVEALGAPRASEGPVDPPKAPQAPLGVPRAVERGFSRPILADSENGLYSHRLLVRPDADLDGSFVAFDVEELDYIVLSGWLYTIEDDQP